MKAAINIKKIRAALAGRKDESAQSWREMRRRIAELNDAELELAHEEERSGRRSMEFLKMIAAEQCKRGSKKRRSMPEVQAFL